MAHFTHINPYNILVDPPSHNIITVCPPYSSLSDLNWKLTFFRDKENLSGLCLNKFI